jgi:hypothetical protein
MTAPLNRYGTKKISSAQAPGDPYSRLVSLGHIPFLISISQGARDDHFSLRSFVRRLRRFTRASGFLGDGGVAMPKRSSLNARAGTGLICRPRPVGRTRPASRRAGRLTRHLTGHLPGLLRALSLCPIALAFVYSITGDAAHQRSLHAAMTGHVAGDSTGNRPLDAALSFGRTRRQRQRCGQRRTH